MRELLNPARWRMAPFAWQCNVLERGLDLTTGRCGIFSWRYLLWYRHGKRVITSFDFISR